MHKLKKRALWVSVAFVAVPVILLGTILTLERIWQVRHEITLGELRAQAHDEQIRYIKVINGKQAKAYTIHDMAYFIEFASRQEAETAVMDLAEQAGIDYQFKTREGWLEAASRFAGPWFFLWMFALWVMALANLLASEFLIPQNKWIWLVTLVFLPFITPILYPFIAVKQQVPDS